ncbi:MAG: PH domain-containing protein [Candidatus Altiarchaeota archaeon]
MKPSKQLSVDDDKIADPLNRPDSSLKLLDGEKIYERIIPHFLAFYNLYLIWIYVAFLSALFIIYYDDLLYVLRSPISILTSMFRPSMGDMGILSGIDLLEVFPIIMNLFFGQIFSFMSSGEYVLAVMWLIPISVFSTAFSVLRIEWKWMPIMMGVAIASIVITVALDLPGVSVYYISLIFSLIGCVGVDVFRKSHRFYVTNYRIITEVKFIGLKQNTLSYDKINNLIVDQPLVGRIFNFGTVIPITASGLGMGEDSASVTIGGGARVGGSGFIGGAITGGRTVGVPRTRSQYALFGVANPKRVYNILSKFMQENVEAPYLKDMSVNIRKMLEYQQRMLEQKK